MIKTKMRKKKEPETFSILSKWASYIIDIDLLHITREWKRTLNFIIKRDKISFFVSHPIKLCLSRVRIKQQQQRKNRYEIIK